MSLKDRILNHLEDCYPSWVHKGVLGKLAVNDWGYENENMGRRCRELATAGKIEKDPNSTEAIYRYVPVKVAEVKVEPTQAALGFKVGGYRG